jgi:hypothetical protein
LKAKITLCDETKGNGSVLYKYKQIDQGWMKIFDLSAASDSF